MFKALTLKIASLIGKGEAWAEFQAAKSNLSNHAGIPRYPMISHGSHRGPFETVRGVTSFHLHATLQHFHPVSKIPCQVA